MRHAENAGFPEIQLELRVSLKATRLPCPWETFLRISGHPSVPPFGDVLHQVLNAGEIIIFTAALKPLVESVNRPERLAFAYLTARKD